SRAHDEEVAAADGFLGEPGRRLAQELAVHDRDAPKMAGAEFLRNLPAIGEIADRIANRQSVGAIEIGETGGAGRGQDALAHAAHELSLQSTGRHGKNENTDAGAPVRRAAPRPLAIYARLGAAADHGGGISRHGGGRLPRPAAIGGGQEDRRAAHWESFGETIVDPNTISFHRTHATSRKGSARGGR